MCNLMPEDVRIVIMMMMIGGYLQMVPDTDIFCFSSTVDRVMSRIIIIHFVTKRFEKYGLARWSESKQQEFIFSDSSIDNIPLARITSFLDGIPVPWREVFLPLACQNSERMVCVLDPTGGRPKT